jgi:hypothetical protein
LPLVLDVETVVVVPCPSKDCVPTSAYGPNGAGAATKDPMVVKANVPVRLALEHPLLAAVAAGATVRASAVTAANAKVFAVMLCFMANLLLS